MPIRIRTRHLFLAGGTLVLLVACSLPALLGQSGDRSPDQPVIPATSADLPAATPAAQETGAPAPAATQQAVPTVEVLLPVVPGSGDAASSLFFPSLSSSANPTSSLLAGTQGLPVWIDPSLPEALRQAVSLPPEFSPAQQRDGAALVLQVGEQPLLSRWVYTLAAPFPTLAQGVSSVDLRNAWNNGPFGAPLLVDDSTYAVFTAKWGPAAQGAVRVLPTADLLGAAWDSSSWAILPFERLEPRWKVLEVDGQSPLRKDFDPAAYQLSVPVALAGDPALASAVGSLYGMGSQAPILPPGNRDPNRLTTLAMTGVTALVRATAFTMEQRGITYPGKDVGEILRSADIAHVSNEVPFAQDCPYPDPTQEGMRFCSDDRYIGLLEDIGTDVVELTGDHFQDWGAEAMLHTLDLYRERGWGYYGGGANLAEGRQALLVEHNGNRLAFIGCNGKGGSFAQAGQNRPGAVTCDFDWMEAEIARLRGEGYLPVVTFQHYEYYTYKAQPNQEQDFRRVARAGAVVVSGSQAHQPQAFEFVDGSLIHYGLGNLFFDQYDISEACRQGFIDRHVFYDGRYIGSELVTIQFVDYARPRLMTDQERQDVLRTVFRASGW